MGKGSGCGSSKNLQNSDSRLTATVSPHRNHLTTSATAISTSATMSATGTKKIYVIFYTTYGHIYKLVEEVVKGINSVSGIEAVVLQVRIIFTSSRCSGAVVVFCSRYFVSADAFPSLRNCQRFRRLVCVLSCASSDGTIWALHTACEPAGPRNFARRCSAEDARPSQTRCACC